MSGSADRPWRRQVRRVAWVVFTAVVLLTTMPFVWTGLLCVMVGACLSTLAREIRDNMLGRHRGEG